MSHMVIYRSVDGKPGFQQTDDLVAAVEFVERLRNIEGVESARIYRLEQVNFRFQPYYQVHLDNDEAPVPPPLTIAAAPPSARSIEAVEAAVAAEVAAGPVAPPVPESVPAPAVAPETEPVAPTLGATPAPEPSDGNGIRRGLFGR